MTVSKAQQRAVIKYMKENYDEFKVRMPKGQKDVIKAHAESHGESLNGFINRAIHEAMTRETAFDVISEAERELANDGSGSN